MKRNKSSLLFFFFFIFTVSGWADSHLSGQTGYSIKLFVDSKSQEISARFPHKTILRQKRVRRIKAVCFSPNSKNVFVANKFEILRYNLKLKKWFKLTRKGINRLASFSALFHDGKNLFAGTTSYGIYKLIKNRWLRISRGLPGEGNPKYPTFYETILSISRLKNNNLIVGLGFGGGIYEQKNNRWKKIHKPTGDVHALYPAGKGFFFFNGKKWLVVNSKNVLPSMLKEAEHLYKRSNFSIGYLAKGKVVSIFKDPYSHIKKTLSKKIRGVRAVYLNPGMGSIKKVKWLLPYLKKRGYNAVVLDVKDDFGRVLYKGKLKIVKATRAYRNRIAVKKFTDYCRKQGFYTIARLVVFKDGYLYRYKKGKYGLKDRYTKRLWTNKSKEKWVNPYSTFVHKYNVAIAKETLGLGFDEVQFDYIRFPTDGKTYRIKYPHSKKGQYKIDALENFLALAKKELKKPFSVDIYGFNGWYEMGKWMGQDASLYSVYADVVSPMLYPSHFDANFRAQSGRAKRTSLVIYEGVRRCKSLAGGRAIIRPYLQAFRWRAYLYGLNYIQKQVKATNSVGVKGYILWNAASDYKVLRELNKK